MQSKISFCNRALLRKNLTRFIPLWAIYLALWIIVMPLSLFNTNAAYSSDALNFQRSILQNAATSGVIINLFYAIFTAMALFSFLYSSRSVNTIAALPVRRETLFGTNLCAGLLVSIVPNILIALLTWMVSAIAGYAMLGTILQWLAIVTMQYLFFFGLACICSCFVGQLLALPILYGILNFAVIVLNYLVVIILSTFVYGLSRAFGDSSVILGRLSPAYDLLTNRGLHTNNILRGAEEITVSYSYGGWVYAAILAAVGILFLAASLLLLRKRHMETAGDLIAIRPLRPVFKYCFTVGCSVVLGMLAASTIFSGSSSPSIFGMSACLLLGGFVGYFGAEMLLKKTVHVFGRAWIGFGVFGVCLIAAICLMEFNAFGYETRVPALSEVEAVSISQSYYRNDTILTDEAHIVDAITLHQRVVDEKVQQEHYSDSAHSDSLTLSYTLKNGKVLSRSYEIASTREDWLNNASLIRQYDAVYNDPYLVELRYTPTSSLTIKDLTSATLSGYDANGTWHDVELDQAEAIALYTECILPDIRDGNLGKEIFYGSIDESQADKRNYAASIGFSFNRTEKNADGHDYNFYDNFDLSVMPEATRTAAILQERGVELTEPDATLYQ